MENVTAVLQKVKHGITTLFSSSTSEYIPKRIESTYSNRYLHTHIHSGTIHKSQKIEATQVSSDVGIGKQSVVCMYNGLLFSLKKEGNYDK